MSDSPIAGRPAADGQDPAYEIARELVGVLPFGARSDTVGRCARLAERVEGERAVAVVVEAIESVTARCTCPGTMASRWRPRWSGGCCTCCSPPATWAGPDRTRR